MSIILKALKKAESTTSKGRSPQLMVSMAARKGLRLRIIVGVCVAALVFFFVGYLMTGKSAFLRPALPPLPKVIAVGPAPEAGAGDAATINSDAVAHIEAGRLKEAEKLLRDAIELHAGDSALYNHLGLALKRQGRISEAREAYEKAVELDPEHYSAINNLAVTLEALGDNDRARELYEGILAKDQSIAGVHLNYALLLEENGDVDEAVSQYHTFLALTDDETLKGLVRKRLRALR